MTVIAMTREIGSRGVEVAEGVAARLGLKIVRSESIADSVARRLGIEPSAFLRYMEGSASLLERWRINRSKLVHYTAEEILRVAQRGNADNGIPSSRPNADLDHPLGGRARDQ